MGHHVCLNCGSENVAEVEYVHAWFKEGDMNRNRVIALQAIEQPDGTTMYHAACPEIAGFQFVGMSQNELLAVKALGDLLEQNYHIKLLGQQFE